MFLKPCKLVGATFLDYFALLSALLTSFQIQMGE